MLSTREKGNIIKKFKTHKSDTGSAAVQIAILTKEIDELSQHLKKHVKDHASRRGLLGMVSQRRKLINYLERNEPKKYKTVAKKLGLKIK